MSPKTGNGLRPGFQKQNWEAKGTSKETPGSGGAGGSKDVPCEGKRSDLQDEDEETMCWQALDAFFRDDARMSSISPELLKIVRMQHATRSHAIRLQLAMIS